jgi:predicted TIM-barrel fold metal-dependent hydrolase
MDLSSLPIADCHLHFVDAQVLRYPVFQQRSAGFEALLGDYSVLPRRYLPADYFNDTRGFNVVKTVWAEFLSDAPVEEARWVRDLAHTSGHRSAAIALADFTSVDVQRVIEDYVSIGGVHAIRQHLAWHPTNPLLRFVSRPDVLSDPSLRTGVATLRKHGLPCEIEIFAPQLPSLTALARACPDVQFILPVLGWPIDLTDAGYQAWRRDMAALSQCQNVAVKVFGLECIFGLGWTVPQVRPWILETIALFGPKRCMFASHMPIALLACSFGKLYSAYWDVVGDFTETEKQQLFHDTAAAVYRL